MKKAELAALEKLFVHEINRAFATGLAAQCPMQSRAKVFRDLADVGMVERVARVIGTGRNAVTVPGWELTHAGRYAYCATCEEDELA
jgi:hypothetical protein